MRLLPTLIVFLNLFVSAEDIEGLEFFDQGYNYTAAIQHSVFGCCIWCHKSDSAAYWQ